jgi:hypothetical protein
MRIGMIRWGIVVYRWLATNDSLSFSAVPPISYVMGASWPCLRADTAYGRCQPVCKQPGMYLLESHPALTHWEASPVIHIGPMQSLPGSKKFIPCYNHKGAPHEFGSD